jgi:hypothetical protein
MIALPSFYDSYSQEKKRIRDCNQRIKWLQREIMFCKMQRREYTRFLAELNELRQEVVEDLKKQLQYPR